MLTSSCTYPALRRLDPPAGGWAYEGVLPPPAQPTSWAAAGAGGPAVGAPAVDPTPATAAAATLQRPQRRETAGQALFGAGAGAPVSPATVWVDTAEGVDAMRAAVLGGTSRFIGFQGQAGLIPNIDIPY